MEVWERVTYEDGKLLFDKKFIVLFLSMRLKDWKV